MTIFSSILMSKRHNINNSLVILNKKPIFGEKNKQIFFTHFENFVRYCFLYSYNQYFFIHLFFLVQQSRNGTTYFLFCNLALIERSPDTGTKFSFKWFTKYQMVELSKVKCSNSVILCEQHI